MPSTFFIKVSIIHNETMKRLNPKAKVFNNCPPTLYVLIVKLHRKLIYGGILTYISFGDDITMIIQMISNFNFSCLSKINETINIAMLLITSM